MGVEQLGVAFVEDGILIDAENRLHGGVNQFVPAWAMGYNAD